MRVANVVPLLDSVSPEVRKLLVRERTFAMRGKIASAIDVLDRAINDRADRPDLDTVALGLLKAELCHLSQDEEAALAVLTSLATQKNQLPETVQFAIEGNLAAVQMASSPGQGVNTFYHLVDRRRQAGFEWTDHQDLLEAQEARDAGRAADAVPPLWQDLVRAYRQGYWLASRRAEARFAKLCLDLGELEKATYYAVVGLADKQVPALIAAIIDRRDLTLIRSVVRRLITDANLSRHFIVAAKVFEGIHDVIPDDQTAEIARWLLLRCRDTDWHSFGTSTFNVGWKALKPIGHRLSSELASQGIHIAVNHPVWLAMIPEGRVIGDRKEIIQAVTHLCHQVSVESLGQLAEQCLPLATERFQNFDYADVVNLLMNIAERCDVGTKLRIADALFPPGQPVNRILAQVDHLLGKEALTNEQLATFAKRVADETKLQVQRVKPGEQPIRLPETLYVYGSTGGGWPYVTVGQGVGLAALEQHRSRLTIEVVTEVIRAMLVPLQDTDNIRTNKERLLSQLIAFTDRADETLRAEIFNVVEPLIGPSAESTSSSFAKAAANGNPDDLRAIALVCAAVYAAGNEERVSRVGEMIEEAAVDPNPKIRRGAYAAAQRFSGLTPDAILPLLMGLRDPEPETAVTAFAAFADRLEWKLTRSNWKLFLLAVRSAADSPHINLRWHAALALTNRVDSVPSGLRRESATILARFETDVSFSVRKAVRRPSSAAAVLPQPQ